MSITLIQNKLFFALDVLNIHPEFILIFTCPSGYESQIALILFFTKCSSIRLSYSFIKIFTPWKLAFSLQGEIRGGGKRPSLVMVNDRATNHYTPHHLNGRWSVHKFNGNYYKWLNETILEYVFTKVWTLLSP